MMKDIWVAKMETQHYTFHGLGLTEDQARAAVIQAFETHIKKIDDPAVTDFWQGEGPTPAEYYDIACFHGVPGSGFRDSESMNVEDV